jgi:bifunctional non-homologous end joining protein LigD
VTPLAAAKLDWATAKGFAQEVCRQMAADSPDRYVLSMSKKLRTGRIFLDYLRNDRTSTAVAPLSPRARPGATVSMPLTWTQVRAGLDPSRFTVRTAAALIAKSPAWEDYGEAERPLAPAIKRLGRKAAA